MTFYAKSNPPEDLDSHVNTALAAFSEIMKEYGTLFSDEEKKIIWLAIRYHDEGKKNSYFQNLMRQLVGLKYDRYYKTTYPNVPHGYLSPAFIPEDIRKTLTDDEKKCLYNAIVFHHTRPQKFAPTEISEYIKVYLKKDFSDLSIAYVNYIVNNSENLKNFNNDGEWIRYAIAKGMLNKADYYASSHSTFPIEKKSEVSINKCVDDFFANNHLKKNEMQAYLQKNAGRNIITIGSTGSGKTEGSLLWTQNKKTFYTLPLRVSINAMYDRIVEKYHYKETSLLHSDAINYLMQNKSDAEDALKKYRISKSLSSPLTVCTIDQIMTFCYKALGTEILLATLKYSNLIIDEIQSYEPELIAKIIYSLKLIKMAGGNFLIMTATLPPVLVDFLKKENVYTEDDLKIESFVSDTIRHKIEYIEDQFDYEKIKELGNTKKVLVICNTVRKAQEVYNELKSDHTWILHSRMIGKDRAEQEKRIFDFAENGDHGIWVTTQIVEASIDVDFDVLFTEMCTADSLLQRLGRCYRKRNYTEAEPNAFIYNTNNNSIYDKTIFNRSIRFIKKHQGIFLEKDKLDYINSVYDIEDDEVLKSEYYQKIKHELEKLKNYTMRDMTEKEAKQTFRNIYSVTVMPISVYNNLIEHGKWDELIDKIKNGGTEERIAAEREIKQYTVQIQSIPRECSIIHEFTKDNTFKRLNMNVTVINTAYEYTDVGYGIGLGFVQEETDNYF